MLSPSQWPRLWRDNRQLRYLVVGVWNTAAGYCIFALFYLAVGKSVDYMAIAVLSHILAVTQSFFMQRRVVFRSQANVWAEYLRFHVAHLGSLGLGLILLTLFVEVAGLDPLLAQAIATAIVVFTSYFVHRHFTFRQANNG
ncbi:MAG: GtrA family protein [Betaproteobacteria bacterium]|nr:GtrA family protein [Betaproteobacteria bacterium]